MTDLRPCPFCGFKEITIGEAFDECGNCGAIGPDKDLGSWNTRVSDGLVTELVEALEALGEHARGKVFNTKDSGRDAVAAVLTRAREAGYGSNLQKMQIGQDGK